jgi:hypothetical protein
MSRTYKGRAVRDDLSNTGAVADQLAIEIKDAIEQADAFEAKAVEQDKIAAEFEAKGREQFELAEGVHDKASAFREDRDAKKLIAGRALIKARETFLKPKEFWAYCETIGPGYGKTRVKELLKMADRSLTDEQREAIEKDRRAKAASRQAKLDKKKAAKKKSVVRTSNSDDQSKPKANGYAKPAEDAEASAAARKAEYEAQEQAQEDAQEGAQAQADGTQDAQEEAQEDEEGAQAQADGTQDAQEETGPIDEKDLGPFETQVRNLARHYLQSGGATARWTFTQYLHSWAGEYARRIFDEEADAAPDLMKIIEANREKAKEAERADRAARTKATKAANRERDADPTA